MQADPNPHPSDAEVDDDDDENLFETSNLNALDAADSSRVPLDDSLLAKWGDPGQTQQLRNRFVTGKSLLHVLGVSGGSPLLRAAGTVVVYLLLCLYSYP